MGKERRQEPFLGGGCGIELRKRRDEAENTNADSVFSTIPLMTSSSEGGKISLCRQLALGSVPDISSVLCSCPVGYCLPGA